MTGGRIALVGSGRLEVTPDPGADGFALPLLGEALPSSFDAHAVRMAKLVILVANAMVDLPNTR